MSDLYNDIRKNAGIDDVYISEGIVFFKNSNKIKRLSKYLEKKHQQLIKKNMINDANALAELIMVVNSIANKFEEVENDFKNSKDKRVKNALKQKYENLESEFKKMLDVAKKESVKKALAATGALAAFAGILTAGIFGFMSFKNTGVLDTAMDNLAARKELIDLNKKTLQPTDDKIEMLKRAGSNIVGGAVLRSFIKNTNQELVTVATAAGATVGGVLSVEAIHKLKKSSIKDKTIADTIRAIEELKQYEEKSTKK